MGFVPAPPPPMEPFAVPADVHPVFWVRAFDELDRDCPPPPGLYDERRQYRVGVIAMYPNPSRVVTK